MPLDMRAVPQIQDHARGDICGKDAAREGWRRPARQRSETVPEDKIRAWEVRYDGA